jgi:hypothetical protein
MSGAKRMKAGTQGTAVASRVSGIPWMRVAEQLDMHGWASLPRLLSVTECEALSSMYDEDERFRWRRHPDHARVFSDR